MKWREGPALMHALRFAQVVNWRDSFLVVGGTFFGDGEYNENIYYFDPSGDSGTWRIWMKHKDAAREKFAAIPITKGTAICSRKTSLSPIVKLQMESGGHADIDRKLIEEQDDIILSCSTLPSPGNFTVSFYFKVK